MFIPLFRRPNGYSFKVWSINDFFAIIVIIQHPPGKVFVTHELYINTPTATILHITLHKRLQEQLAPSRTRTRKEVFLISNHTWTDTGGSDRPTVDPGELVVSSSCICDCGRQYTSGSESRYSSKSVRH